MPLDADLKALMDKAAGAPRLETLDVAEARRLWEARPRPPALDVGHVEERSIDGPGGPMRLRIYTPGDGAAPRPLLVFYHGSGFVLCSLDTHDGMCRNLCAGSGYVVVSVDYRLAPDAKFPAGLDDCLAATRWAAANADALGTMPGFIVIGGDSAGGNMAAATALRCRDEAGPGVGRSAPDLSRHRPLQRRVSVIHRKLPRATVSAGRACAGSGTIISPRPSREPTRSPRRCARRTWRVCRRRWC